jgi:hypothetical protein
MRILNDKDPKYYIESEAELDNIPENAPVGTKVLLNAEDDIAVYIKNEAGTFYRH